jgi:hypothetical protein
MFLARQHPTDANKEQQSGELERKKTKEIFLEKNILFFEKTLDSL